MDNALIMRAAMWGIPMLLAAGSAWAVVRVTLKFHARDLERVRKGTEDMETRISKKIDDLGEHIEEDITGLRGNIKTLFDKYDGVKDAIGDMKLVLTVMAGKVGNPGNDKELIEMIRVIGKKRNGR